MINPATRTKSIELSQIRKMFEVTNPNAINLGIGEPDFDVPAKKGPYRKKFPVILRVRGHARRDERDGT